MKIIEVILVLYCSIFEKESVKLKSMTALHSSFVNGFVIQKKRKLKAWTAPNGVPEVLVPLERIEMYGENRK